MEIKFALWKYIKDEFGELRPVSPIIVSTWEDVGEKRKEGYDLKGLTYPIFQQFKGLQYNEYFLQEKRVFKEKFQVPNEVSFPKYLKNIHYFMSPKNLTKERLTEEIIYSNLLNTKYSMPSYIYDSLGDLFYTEIIRFVPPLRNGLDISVEPKQNWLPPRKVQIEIISPLVTQRMLIDFIRNNWEMLKRQIKELPSFAKSSISDRDLKLLKTRQAGNIERKITDIVYVDKNKHSQKEIIVEESAINSALYRAQEKVNELFYPLPTEKKN